MNQKQDFGLRPFPPFLLVCEVSSTQTIRLLFSVRPGRTVLNQHQFFLSCLDTEVVVPLWPEAFRLFPRANSPFAICSRTCNLCPPSPSSSSPISLRRKIDARLWTRVPPQSHTQGVQKDRCFPSITAPPRLPGQEPLQFDDVQFRSFFRPQFFLKFGMPPT